MPTPITHLCFALLSVNPVTLYYQYENRMFTSEDCKQYMLLQKSEVI